MAVGFNYPETPHTRRHGPQGYAGYDSFRPWLRDEFSFCCVYCLVREQWGRVSGEFNRFSATCGEMSFSRDALAERADVSALR